MAAFGARLHGSRNRRRCERASVLLPASVVTLCAYQYLELINLSATGARLRGSMIPAVGKAGIFRLDELKVLCKVVWATEDLCGVKFDEPIPLPVLAHFSRTGSTAQIGMLTPDEKQIEEEWSKWELP